MNTFIAIRNAIPSFVSTVADTISDKALLNEDDKPILNEDDSEILTDDE